MCSCVALARRFQLHIRLRCCSRSHRVGFAQSNDGGASQRRRQQHGWRKRRRHRRQQRSNSRQQIWRWVSVVRQRPRRSCCATEEKEEEEQRSSRIQSRRSPVAIGMHRCVGLCSQWVVVRSTSLTTVCCCSGKCYSSRCHGCAATDRRRCVGTKPVGQTLCGWRARPAVAVAPITVGRPAAIGSSETETSQHINRLLLLVCHTSIGARKDCSSNRRVYNTVIAHFSFSTGTNWSE